MCDIHGESKCLINQVEYNKLAYKISKFDKNKIALYKNGRLIRNSITVLGKYYYGKQKEIRYLACDGRLNKASMTRKELQAKYKEIQFSNIKLYSNGSIRMLNGSIPFLNNLETLRNNNTVVKLSNITGITPGYIGVSKKFFGKRVMDGKVGCIKFELFPNSYDIKNEVLAYELGKLLKFDVAEASFEEFDGHKCIISIYNYDVHTEKIASLKSEIGTDNFHKRFNKNWFIQNKSLEAFNKFIQMIMLDLIMHQTDRHISNIAFKNNQLYSLYDNGEHYFMMILIELHQK